MSGARSGPASVRPPISVLLAITLLAALLPLPARAERREAATPGAFTIGVLSLPASLNPLIDLQPQADPQLPATDITDALFESLLAADTHNALIPSLATGYTVSADGTRYQFHIDPRARWQDGVPVTAADVLYTARLMRDPRFPAASRFGFGNIATIAATGGATVTVTLRSPYAPFLRAFATTPLLPAHMLEPIPVAKIAGYQAFNRRPIGNGPYTVGEFVDGDHITLDANPSYYRAAPRIPRLIFRLEPSEAAALRALRAGTVQMLGPSAGLTPRDLLAALGGGTLSAYASPGFGWAHIDLIESGFLRDRLVRQALTYATPRQRIIATQFGGLVTAADADQPPTSRYYEPRVAGTFPYAPSKVAGLLRAHGFARTKGRNEYGKFGRALRITLWLDSSCGDCRAVAATIAASWAAAGIPTSLRAVPTHALLGPSGPLYNPTRLTDLALNAVLYTWYTSRSRTTAPTGPAPRSYGPAIRPAATSWATATRRMDALLSRALTTTDDAARISTYRAIQRLLASDQPPSSSTGPRTSASPPTPCTATRPTPSIRASPGTWPIGGLARPDRRRSAKATSTAVVVPCRHAIAIPMDRTEGGDQPTPSVVAALHPRGAVRSCILAGNAVLPASPEREDRMRTDQMFKDLLRTFFADFLSLFLSEVFDAIDSDSITFLDTELFTDFPEGQQRLADLVAQVRTRDGTQAVVLLHTEVQAQRQDDFGRRMWQYNLLLRLREGVPTISIAIVLYGETPGISIEHYGDTIFGRTYPLLDY